MGKIRFDIVTLIRYTVGTVRNCESGPEPARNGPAPQKAFRPVFIWENGVAGKRAKKSEMVPVVGVGGKPQLQRVSSRHWTKLKEQRFLLVLGHTCNVTRACEAVGMTTSGAYMRRQKNAQFRASWVETLARAYDRLELVLLDRSLNGTEKVVRRDDGSEIRMHEFPNRLGLSLLKMHRSAGEQAARPAPEEEDDDAVRERVIRKLLRLKNRDAR